MLNCLNGSLFFQPFEYVIPLHLASLASDKKSNVLLRIPWNDESFFSLLISRFSFCCCVFDNLTMMYLSAHQFEFFPCLGLLSFLDLQINVFHQTENHLWSLLLQVAPVPLDLISLSGTLIIYIGHLMVSHRSLRLY